LSLEISDKFKKAVDSLGTSFEGVSKAAIKSFDDIVKSSGNAAKGFEALGTAGESSFASTAKGWSGVGDSIDNIVGKLKDVEDAYKRINKIPMPSALPTPVPPRLPKPVPVPVPPVSTASIFDAKDINRAIKSVEDELFVLIHDLDDIEAPEIIDAKSLRDQLGVLREAWDEMSKFEQETFGAEVASKGLSKALESLAGDATAVGIKMAEAGTKMLDANYIKTQVKDVAGQIEILATVFGSMDAPAVVDAKKMEAGLQALDEVWGSLSDVEKKAFSVTNATVGLGAALKEMEKRGAITIPVTIPTAESLDVKSLSKAIHNIGDEILVLKSTMGGTESAEFFDKTVLAAQLKLIKDVWKDLDDSTKTTFQATVASKGYAEAVDELNSKQDGLSQRLRNVAKAAMGEVTSIKTLSDELKNAGTVTGILKSRFLEGRKEAEEFAGGLGKSATGLMAVGVAAFFLAKKAADLVDAFTAARMSLAKYRIETVLAGKETLGFSKTSLESLRKNLNLTREQAKDFFKVVAEGTNVVGMAPSQIMAVSKALTDTFGGDQTARLKEYIELLKELPRADTDLKITASMDDETSAIFALAEKGKMEVAIDLQQAGLLGGAKKVDLGKDKDVLNAQQKTEAGVQAVNDTMLQFYPAWGSQFSAIAGYTFKTLAAIGGIAGVLGAMKLFGGASLKVASTTAKNAAAIKLDTSIIARQSVIPGQPHLPRVGPPPLPVGSGVATEVGIFAKVSAKASQVMQSGISTATKFVKGIGMAGKVTLGVGLALEAAGWAADWLSEKMEKSGDTLGAAGVKAGGEMAKFAGTIAGFAALGSIIPGVGTAIGALVGTIVALYMNLDQMGMAIARFGHEIEKAGVTVDGQFIPKFNKYGKAFGENLAYLGDGLAGFGKALKRNTAEVWGYVLNPFKKAGKDTSLLTKSIGYLSAGLARAVMPTLLLADAARLTAKAMQSDKYKEAMARAGKAADKLQDTLTSMKKTGEEYDKTISEDRKTVMESGLVLQMEMSRLKNAFEGGQFALVNFEAELANLKIEGLSEAGGSASAFSRAINDSTKSITKRFDMASKEIERSRQNIANNTKLEGEQRKNALDRLHKIEIEAARQFVNSMDKVIDALLKTPQIIQSGLQAELVGAKMDVMIDVGALSTEDVMAGTMKQISAYTQQLDGTLKAQTEGEKKLAEMRKKLDDSSAKSVGLLEKSMPEIGKSLPEDMQDAADAFKKSMASKTEAGGTKISKGKENEVADAAGAYADVLKEKMDGIKKQLPEASFESFAASIGVVQKQADKAKAALTGIKAKMEDYSEEDLKSPKKAQAYADLQEQAKKMEEAANAANVEAEKSTLAMKDYLSNIISQSDLLADEKTALMNDANMQKTLTNVGKAISEGRDLQAEDLLEQLGSAEKANKVLGVLFNKVLDKNKPLVEQLKMLRKEYGTVANIKAEAEAVADKTDGVTKQQQNQLKLQQKVNETQKKIIDTQKKLTNIMQDAGIHQAQRQLAALNEASAMAGMMGDPTEEVTAALSKQVDLWGEQMKSIKKRLVQLKNDEKSQKEAVTTTEKAAEEAKKAVKDGDMASQLRADEAVAAANNAKIALNATEQSVADLEKQSADIAKSFPKIGDSLTKGIEEFRNSLTGQEIQSHFDMSEALNELSQFSDQSGDMAKEAAATSIAAAKKRYSYEAKSRERFMAAERKALEKRISEAPEEDKAQVKADGESAMAAKERALKSKQEVDYKKSVLEAAEKEVQFKLDLVDSSQSVAEAELDLAQQMGNHFSTVVDKQKEILGYEAQRVEAAKQVYENYVKEAGLSAEAAANDKTAILLKNKARLAEINLQKKSMGMQRTLFEQMLGSAFGQARSSVGARRQRGSDTSILGYEGSRVKSAATGAFSGAGKEGVKPYWKRVAEMKGSVKGAQRLTPEKELAKGMKETAKKTDETAQNTKKAAGSLKRGDTPGSFYTHDTTSEGYLASILYVAQEMAVGINDIATGQTEGAVKVQGAGESYRDKLAKGVADKMGEVAKNAQKATEEAKKQTEAQEKATSATVEGQKAQEKAIDTKSPEELKAEATKKHYDAYIAKTGKDPSNDATAKDLQNKMQKAQDALQASNTAEGKAAKQAKKTEKFETKSLVNDKKENVIDKKDIKESVKTEKAVTEMAKKDEKPKGERYGDTEEYRDKVSKMPASEQQAWLKGTKWDKTQKADKTAVAAKDAKRDAVKQSKAVAKQIKQNKTESKNQMAGSKFKGNELGGTAKGKIKTIEDTFKSMSMKGGGKGKTMGDVAKGGAAGKGSAAMIGFDTAAKTMTNSAKQTELSSKDVADVVAKSRGVEPVGGGVGIQTAKSAAGAGGGTDTGTSQATKLSIEGNFNIRFNNDMFKNEVAKLLPTLISTAEVTKALQVVFKGS
jgi:hypothetical protein